jgi:predicted Zn-dependent protease
LRRVYRGGEVTAWRAAAIEAEAYELFEQGRALLAERHPHEAVSALERARSLEPERGSVRELLARAYYAAGRVADAKVQFAEAVDADPTNDYAHFGLALCLLKAGQASVAVGHLRMALAMRPGVADYERALARAKAVARPRQVGDVG